MKTNEMEVPRRGHHVLYHMNHILRYRFSVFSTFLAAEYAVQFTQPSVYIVLYDFTHLLETSSSVPRCEVGAESRVSGDRLIALIASSTALSVSSRMGYRMRQRRRPRRYFRTDSLAISSSPSCMSEYTRQERNLGLYAYGCIPNNHSS